MIICKNVCIFINVRIGKCKLTKRDVVREEVSHIIGDEFGKIENSVINNFVTNVRTRWKRKINPYKVNYVVNPLAFRIGGGGRHDRCPEDIRHMSFRNIFFAAFDNSTFVDKCGMQQVVLDTISSHGGYQGFVKSSHGYDKRNRQHLLINDKWLGKFRRDYKLLSLISGKTQYAPAHIIEQQIPSLIISLIVRRLLPIKFSMYLPTYLPTTYLHM